jgi:hypothetical protein
MKTNTAAIAVAMMAAASQSAKAVSPSDHFDSIWLPAYMGGSTPRHAPNGRGRSNAAMLKREAKARKARKVNPRGLT